MIRIALGLFLALACSSACAGCAADDPQSAAMPICPAIGAGSQAGRDCQNQADSQFGVYFGGKVSETMVRTVH
jgi:hypothetical protein